MLMSKKLDPRLRRLIASSSTAVSMKEAVGRGEVTATSDDLVPSRLKKRVLIEVNELPPGGKMAGADWTHVSGNIYTASVALSQLEQLAALDEVETVEAGRKWFAMLDTSLSETRADTVHQGFGGMVGRTGQGVLVGIIDFGMDFTLDDFRNPDGTIRQALLWDQSIPALSGEKSPGNFPNGVEYNADTINQALSDSNPFQTKRHQPGESSHGTHVEGFHGAGSVDTTTTAMDVINLPNRLS